MMLFCNLFMERPSYIAAHYLLTDPCTLYCWSAGAIANTTDTTTRNIHATMLAADNKI